MSCVLFCCGFFFFNKFSKLFLRIHIYITHTPDSTLARITIAITAAIASPAKVITVFPSNPFFAIASPVSSPTISKAAKIKGKILRILHVWPVGDKPVLVKVVSHASPLVTISLLSTLSVE